MKVHVVTRLTLMHLCRPGNKAHRISNCCMKWGGNMGRGVTEKVAKVNNDQSITTLETYLYIFNLIFLLTFCQNKSPQKEQRQKRVTDNFR